MKISVVIPCYQSEKTIKDVVYEARKTLKECGEYDYQFVLVNDGSPDHTCLVIKQLCEEDSRIIGVNLSRNFGQASARMAALPYISGDIAVYMDDDGQHPASQIMRLIEKIQEGYDVVYAKFVKKQCSLFKKITSEINAKIMEFLEVKPKGIADSSFFAWSRFAIEAAQKYHSPFVSVDVYLTKVTSRFSNIEMEQRARKAGKSGYTLKKLISLAIQGYTNFSIIPLRIAAIIGASVSGIGFILGIIMVIRKLLDPTILMGYTSQMAVLLIMGGIIMMTLGLLGEYIGRIYMTISNMPQFMVREEYGIKPVLMDEKQE